MNDLPTIAHNLHTQDNRITANPIFVVQQRKRTAGFDADYADQYVWVDDSSEEVDEGKTKQLDRADESGRFDETNGYRKVWYRDEWVFVQPFFTERGAQDYIAVNGHNLTEPRIYVESGYRNTEWQLVREHLMSLATP